MQINDPEFTLTTVLPVAKVIDAAIDLKIEACFARPVAKDSEPARVLNRAVCSTKLEAIASEAVRLSTRLFF